MDRIMANDSGLDEESKSFVVALGETILSELHRRERLKSGIYESILF